jgi:hypothetical protein
MHTRSLSRGGPKPPKALAQYIAYGNTPIDTRVHPPSEARATPQPAKYPAASLRQAKNSPGYPPGSETGTPTGIIPQGANPDPKNLAHGASAQAHLLLTIKRENPSESPCPQKREQGYPFNLMLATAGKKIRPKRTPAEKPERTLVSEHPTIGNKLGFLCTPVPSQALHSHPIH